MTIGAVLCGATSPAQAARVEADLAAISDAMLASIHELRTLAALATSADPHVAARARQRAARGAHQAEPQLVERVAKLDQPAQKVAAVGKVALLERQQRIAKALGVSRTPVRAALAKLTAEGLILHQPKRGYQIREFRLSDLVARPHLASGALVPVLAGAFDPQRVPIYAVMPPERARLPKIAACIGHWRGWLAGDGRPPGGYP